MSRNTKDNILEAAVELFATGGYHETSMSEIASKAGISKGTLYWYFSGKEELFSELITTGFKVLFTEVKKIIKKDISADQMFYKYLKTKVSFLEKHKKIAKIAVENMEVLSPEIKENAMEKHKEMLNQVAKIIDKGKKEGIYRDINSVHTAFLVIGMTNCINSDVMFAEKSDMEEKVDFIYDFIKNGISNS